MSTINTINNGQNAGVVRGNLNTNFANLNTDKLEQPALDAAITALRGGVPVSGDTLNKLFVLIGNALTASSIDTKAKLDAIVGEPLATEAQINQILSTIASDNINYDTLQELVDFITTIDTSGELLAVIDTAVGNTDWRSPSGGSSVPARATLNLNTSQVIDFTSGKTIVIDTPLSSDREITAINNASATDNRVFVKVNDPAGFALSFAVGLNVTEYGDVITDAEFIFEIQFLGNDEYAVIYPESKVDAGQVSLPSAGYSGKLNPVIDTVDKFAEAYDQSTSQVSEDTTPQLSGNLDTNGHQITRSSTRVSVTTANQSVDWTSGEIIILDFASTPANPDISFIGLTPGAGRKLYIKQGATARQPNWNGNIFVKTGEDTVSTTENLLTEFEVTTIEADKHLLRRTGIDLPDPDQQVLTQEKRSRISFSNDAGSDLDATWNKLKGGVEDDANYSEALTLIDGSTPSGWTFTNINNWGSAIGSSISPTPGTGELSPDVINGYHSNNANNPDTAIKRFSGLDPTKFYTIGILSVAPPAVTVGYNSEWKAVHLPGDTANILIDPVAQQNSANTQYFEFVNLQPDAGGVIDIVAYDGDGGANAIYLNAMYIEQYNISQ